MGDVCRGGTSSGDASPPGGTGHGVVWWAEGCFGEQKRCFLWDTEEMEPLESSGSEIRHREVGPRLDGVILAAGTGSHPD